MSKQKIIKKEYNSAVITNSKIEMSLEAAEKQGLVQKTLDILKITKFSYNEIVENTGLNYHWLVAFGLGRVKQPGADRVVTLYEFLTGERLL